jgi:hypothetical protein
VGFVDAADRASLILARGVAEREEHRQSAIQRCIPLLRHKDHAHEAKVAVDFSHADPFWGVSFEQTLEQVGHCLSYHAHSSRAPSFPPARPPRVPILWFFPRAEAGFSLVRISALRLYSVRSSFE